MKVQVGKDNYGVRFDYTDVEREKYRAGDIRVFGTVGRNTICTISKLDIDRATGRCVIKDIIAYAEAKLNPEDSYDGVYGRWLAFRRALGRIDDRQVRKALGDAYNTTLRLPQFDKVDA